MIETGLVAGYLALAVARGVDRYVTNKVDALLQSLERRVRSALGPAPARDLRLDPTDRRRQESIARALDRRARRDPRFARDLAGLTDRLDRAGGRSLLADVWTSGPVTVGHGNSVQVNGGRDTAGRDINRVTMRHPGDLHGKPVLVQVGFWLAALLAVTGFGLVGYSFFETFRAGDTIRDTGPSWIVDNTPVVPGGVCFFFGLVLAVASSIGAAVSRSRDD